ICPMLKRKVKTTVMKFAQNLTHRQSLLKALTLAILVLASVMPPTVLANESEKATFNSTTTLQTILTSSHRSVTIGFLV
ncbi:MAG: hypothetical protein ACYT04_40820, partial [Nostoc sp.]